MNARSVAKLNPSKGAADAVRIAVTVAKETKMTNSNLAKIEKVGDQIRHPGRPQHVHTCLGDDGESPHSWMCDSPYCEVMVGENCTEHGGLPPIRMGREPWRGIR